MNILVTGSNGQLGTELRRRCGTLPHHFVFTDVTEIAGVETIYLDITNADAIRIIMASERIDFVINCAAYTNVDAAETDIALADLLNHTAPGLLAQAAAARGAQMIHISTDYVFPGTGCLPIKETDTPDPRSVYGATKLAGEIAVQAALPAASAIIRTAWLYSPWGRNFVKTMLRLTAEKPDLKVVYDQIGSPTYAGDLADAILQIVRAGLKPGIYNYTDEGAVSWYDFACEIASLGGHTTCRIEPCLSAEFPSKVCRPHYSVLDKSLIKSTYGLRIPHWKASLETCIAELNK